MKRFKLFACSIMAAAALCLAPAVSAAPSTPTSKTSFALTSTDIAGTNSHAIISANGLGTPRVEYLSASSDATAGAVQFYRSAESVPVTLATNASQAVVWCVGTTFAANDIVVLRHVAADTYERLVVSASTSTNVTFTGNISAAVVAGDLIYEQSSSGAGAIPVGVATKEIVAGGNGAIFNGIEGRPLYLEIGGGTNCQINLVSGSYDNFRWRR
jgi:hypothetical protein